MSFGQNTRAGLSELRGTYDRTVDGWLRPDQGGWRFTDTQGEVYRLSAEDGDRIHHAARERIDELFASLEGQSWLLVVAAMVVGFLGLKMADEFVLYGAMPTGVYFVPCLLFLCKDVIAEVQFAWAMNKWRGDLAKLIRSELGCGDQRQAYSLFNDERLGVWIGWALFGPGMIGFLVAYDYGEAFFLFLGMMGAGIFVLRAAYGLDG